MTREPPGRLMECHGRMVTAFTLVSWLPLPLMLVTLKPRELSCQKRLPHSPAIVLLSVCMPNIPNRSMRISIHMFLFSFWVSITRFWQAHLLESNSEFKFSCYWCLWLVRSIDPLLFISGCAWDPSIKTSQFNVLQYDGDCNHKLQKLSGVCLRIKCHYLYKKIQRLHCCCLNKWPMPNRDKWSLSCTFYIISMMSVN